MGWCSERIDPQQNRGDRGLLNVLQESGGQNSKGETVCVEVVARGHNYRVQ